MASKKKSSKKSAPKAAKKGHGIKIVGESGVTEQSIDLVRPATKRGRPDVALRAFAGEDGPPPKKAKTPKPAKERKPSMLDAAATVLAAEGELDCKAIIAEAANRLLWESPAGKTPDRTLYAALQREISRKGKHSRFKQTGPGKFALAAGAKS